MNSENRKTLTSLVSSMRSKAAKIGPMHAWWEDIFLAEGFLRQDNELSSDEQAEAWIKEFDKGLSG